MKKYLYLVAMSLIFVSCGEKTIDSSKLQEKNGVYYAENQTKGYTGKSVTKYADGKLRTEANFKDGKLDGVYKVFNIDGKLEEERTYKNGTYSEKSNVEFAISGTNDIEKKSDSPNFEFTIKNSRDPFVVYALSEPVNGAEFSFLNMEVNSSIKTEFAMQIFFATEGKSFNESQSIHFTTTDGIIIVPLSKNTLWSKEKNIDKIRVDFERLPAETEVIIKTIEFQKAK